MGYVVFKKQNSFTYEFETQEETGAKLCVMIAGFLFPVMGLGILGNEIGGTWLMLTGIVAGGILGVAFNSLFAFIAKWSSLLALSGVLIYGAITAFL